MTSRLFASAVVALGLAAPVAAHADSQTPQTSQTSYTDVSIDRARALSARATVEADAYQVDLAVERVDDLRVEWDRAVRAGHPNAAGRLAVAHYNAMVERRHAQDALRYARRNLHAARAQLRDDEQLIQRG